MSATARRVGRLGGRATTHADRAGDPLDGLVNLFDLAIVLAVAFLLAALASLKLTDVLSNHDVTIVRNPGQSDQTVIIKHAGDLKVIHLTKQQAEGRGVPLGTVYRLVDGRVVYVPGK